MCRSVAAECVPAGGMAFARLQLYEWSTMASHLVSEVLSCPFWPDRLCQIGVHLIKLPCFKILESVVSFIMH